MSAKCFVAFVVSALSLPAHAQCPDDAFEPNDTCATATPLAVGMNTGFTSSGTNEDWYTFTIDPGASVDFNILGAAPISDILVIDVFDACGGPQTGTAIDFFSNAPTFLRTNFELTPLDLKLRVTTETPQNACQDYDIEIVVFPAPACFPDDDAFEDNDDAANAVPIALGSHTGLIVYGNDEDWYELPTIPPGFELTVTATFTTGVAISAAELDGSFLATPQSQPGSSNIVLTSFGSGNVNALLRVRRTAFSVCGDYELDLVMALSNDPCVSEPDDILEQNDTCATATPIDPNTDYYGLVCKRTDDDYYRFTLPAGEFVSINWEYNGFDQINGELFDATDCTTILAAPTSDFIVWENLTGVDQELVLRLFNDGLQSPDCVPYALEMQVDFPPTEPCFPPTPDALEPNDSYSTATLVTTFPTTFSNLFSGGGDQDYFEFVLNDNQTVLIDAFFDQSIGNLTLFLDCDDCLPTPPVGMDTIVIADSNTPNEHIQFTNTTGAPATYWIRTFNPEGCNFYDLDIDVIQGPPPATVIEPFCFGDGSGTPCPCGNNVAPGTESGCVNSTGAGAVLTATGLPSLADESLALRVSGGTATSFALLASGNNQLPMSNPGAGLQNAGDGLRCVGGGFVRHGTRALNANGETAAPWGPPAGPVGGVLGSAGFGAGQVRHFQAFYRDDDMQVCQQGFNTTNAVTVVVEN